MTQKSLQILQVDIQLIKYLLRESAWRNADMGFHFYDAYTVDNSFAACFLTFLRPAFFEWENYQKTTKKTFISFFSKVSFLSYGEH